MPINRAAFFAAVRESGVVGRPLKQRSVLSLEAILDVFEKRYPTAIKEQVAYCMATARHEAWSPKNQEIDYAIEEIGGRSRSYGKTGFFGRGMSQLTHEDNYRRASAYFGVDLVKNPDLALTKDISAGCLVIGSMLGWFRGDEHGRHTLPRYFSPEHSDPLHAREIINGDTAKNGPRVAGYYRLFLAALIASEEAKLVPEPQKPPVAPVPPVPAPQPPRPTPAPPVPPQPTHEPTWWERIAERLRERFPKG